MTARSRTLTEELVTLSVTASPDEVSRTTSLERTDKGQRQGRSSTYRQHSCCHGRHSSSNSSRERTPRRERRIKRKWAIHNYNEDKKDTSKLNPFELIESSCNWMIDQEDASSKDYIKFIQHISFISSKAKTYEFNDKAHIIYDRHIRKLCEKEGYDAFGAGNQGLALRFYSFENLRSKTTINTARTPCSVITKDGYTHATTLTETLAAFCKKNDCNYRHWCSKCGSDGHTRQKCKKD